MLTEVTKPFLEGALAALAEVSGRPEYQEPPLSNLRPVLEQTFLSEKVTSTPSIDQWAAFEGCTPFVEEESFNGWSERVTEAAQALDPLYVPESLPIWNLAMAVAWIGWRNISDVRGQWPDYWAKRGGDRGGKLSILLDEDASGTMSDAERALFAAAYRGDIEIFGVDQSSGERVAIPIVSLPNLELAADLNFADRLDTKGSAGSNTRYRDLSVNSAQILELWPPEGGKSPPISGPEPGSTKPQANQETQPSTGTGQAYSERTIS